MTVSLKKEILRLRGENKTYDEIKDLLGCSKATISYHCTRNGIGNNKPIIDNELVNQINDYYLNHTIDEVVKRFNISRSTVIRYTDNKRIKLSYSKIYTILKKAIKCIGNQRILFGKIIQDSQFLFVSHVVSIFSAGILVFNNLSSKFGVCSLSLNANCSSFLSDVSNTDILIPYYNIFIFLMSTCVSVRVSSFNKLFGHKV